MVESARPECRSQSELKPRGHAILEVLSPDRLTRAEFDEFLRYAGLATDGYDAAREAETMIDYEKFISNMMIGKPLQSMKVGVRI